jgi:hypothetical protein
MTPDERDVALFDLVHQVHDCVDLTNGKLEDLAKDVGAIATSQAVDSGRIDKLAKLFGAEKVAPGEEKPRSHAVATWGPVRAVGGVAAALLGAVAAAAALIKGGSELAKFTQAVWPSVVEYLVHLK